MRILYAIHTSPKRFDFVKEYMFPCFWRYGVRDIAVWNDESMHGQLSAWVDCAKWIMQEKANYDGTWHLEDDVVPCKKFKEISEDLAADGIIVQGFTTECRFADFKGKTGVLPVEYLPYGMQCTYIPNRYLDGFISFTDNYVKTGLYKKRQYDCGTLYSDNVFRGFMRKYHKGDMVNVLDNCMVEHVDYLIGGRSVGKQPKVDRKARKFDNYEEVRRLERWINKERYNGETKD